MKQKFLSYNHSVSTTPGKDASPRRLIIFFAGWGMDDTVFADLRKPGYDVMVVYDYRDLAFDTSLVSDYDEICIIAWSLGVWHADRFITQHNELPITRTIAVNGTLTPVSDIYGIPPRIYDLTALLPDQRSLLKFYRRICGGQESLQSLMPILPQRYLDELRDELLAVRQRIDINENFDTSNWDEIFISDKDLIFPPDNMRRAWDSASSRVKILSGSSHALDFKEFVNNAFVDKILVGDRFASALPTYESDAEVQRRVADELLRCATTFLKKNVDVNILEVGSGTGVFAKIYQPMFANCQLSLWDLAPANVNAINGNSISTLACDAELQIKKLKSNTVDYLFSSSTIQWFNSPRRFLREVVRVLSPGGCAFISSYVDGTIPELELIEGASPMHYPHLDDVIASLPNIEYTTATTLFELPFPTAREALLHLRATGVNSLNRSVLPVSKTKKLMDVLTADGKAVLKFNTQFIIIRKNG